MPQSFFSFSPNPSLTTETDPPHTHQTSNIPDIDLSMQNSPAPSPFVESDSQNVSKVREFAQILVEHGCSENIPFSALSSLVTSIIDFLAATEVDDRMYFDHQLKELVRTSSSFDYYLHC